MAAWICEAERLRDLLQGRLAQRLHLEWYDPVETPTVHAGIVESGILVYDSESA